MPAAAITFYESTDTSQVSSLTFSDIVPGVPTAAVEVHIWNDKGGTLGSDTATDLQIFVLGRFSVRGGGDPDDYLSSGLELLDQRSIEMRIIGFDGVTGSTTGWKPLGTNAFLESPDLPSNTAVLTEIRVNAPASASESAIDIAIRVENAPTAPLGLGHYVGNKNGIHAGINDGTFTHLASASDVTENTVPDADALLQEMSWVHEGIPYNLLSEVYTWTNLDNSAVALTSGEEYWALISLGTSRTITKTDKGTSPLADSLRPDVPAGEIPIAYVRVQFDLVVDNADIYNVWKLGMFGQINSALTATIGAGIALVDNNYVRHSGNYDVTLDASSTSEVFLMPGGLLSVTTDGSRPDDRALVIWEFVTDGSSVTSFTDKRRYLNEFLVPLDIYGGPLTTSNYATWTNGYDVPVYIRPGESIHAVVHDAGTALTVGSYIFEIETYDAAGTWTTIFTSSGTDDRRPTIAYNAYEDNTALPEVLEVGPGKSIRAKINTLPTGTTVAAGATVTIPMEIYS